MADAGAVSVVYGASNPAQIGAETGFFTQNSMGVEEAAGAADAFGAALATGDFDGDGFDDLAIGVPGEDVGSGPINEAGAVSVLYGGPAGLAAAGDQFIVQRRQAANDVEANDRFGTAVAAADFSGGSQADLAVGAPLEDSEIPVRANTGLVSVYDGGAAGLVTTQARSFTSNTIAVDDRLGTALAAGEFGRGAVVSGLPGKADVVAGKPGSQSGAGAVEIFYIGSNSFSRQVLTQAQLGITVEAGDAFGSAVAVGNFGAGSRDDLAAGAPLENIEASGLADAGVVGVFYGQGDSLSTAGADVWDQGSAAVGTVEAGDQFGAALTTGNLGKSGQQDLAIGAPLEDIAASSGTQVDAGAVAILYGDSAAGLVAPGDSRIPQPNFNYGPPDRARLGASLAAGNFGSSQRLDLASGAPLFPQFTGPGSSTNGQGLVGVLFGRESGISQGVVPGELALFTQDETGDPREAGDQFGAALAPAAGRTLLALPVLP